MKVEIPQINTNEPRLFSETYNQNQADQSFEEKLKFEKARLGLLFSPFSQLEALFSSSANQTFNSNIEESLNTYMLKESLSPNASEKNQNYAASPASQAKNIPQIFESVPLRSLNQQMVRELLSKTNWLVPNLEASPPFYQAFLEGKLQPKFDMQSLIDQIISQVKLVKDKGKTELSLTLKPEELGDIILILTSRSGIVSIQIKSSPETKKLIESQRAELELALKKAHIDVEKIQIEEVTKNA